MVRKTRAQQDAEILAALEQSSRKIDSGELTLEQVQAGLEPGDELEPEPSPEPEPVPNQESAPVVGDDIAELKHQLANMKRTLSFYEQELNPAQKRAQQPEHGRERAHGAHEVGVLLPAYAQLPDLRLEHAARLLGLACGDGYVDGAM